MLEKLREEVCQVAKRAQADGLCKHRAGNFSARDEETNYVVITPSGIDREQLTVRDLIVIDREANIIENTSQLKPTSETLMHLAIYDARPDAHAIVHTHSLFATTFAVLRRPIPAIVYEVSMLGLTQARIPVAPYGRPGTEDLARKVVASCHEAECFLLEKHGAVAFDANSIDEAYLKAAYVEEIAHLYHNVLTVSGGVEPEHFSQQELADWKYPEQIHVDE